jgi:hypothetical protein
MFTMVRSTTALLVAGALAGCAADGTLETSSLSGQPAQQAARTDPACTALFTHIEELRRDGIAEKVEKAANKKYKMTNADLVKADQLNKANGDFQAKCTPKPVQASVQPVTPATSATPTP